MLAHALRGLPAGSCSCHGAEYRAYSISGQETICSLDACCPGLDGSADGACCAADPNTRGDAWALDPAGKIHDAQVRRASKTLLKKVLSTLKHFSKKC